MASQRLLFWGSGCVPAWRVNATLQEKCLDFEPKLVQFSKGALLQQHAAVYWYEFKVGQLFFVTLRCATRGHGVFCSYTIVPPTGYRTTLLELQMLQLSHISSQSGPCTRAIKCFVYDVNDIVIKSSFSL
jgi:hypothetical protein